jgi:hypothetical protein
MPIEAGLCAERLLNDLGVHMVNREPGGYDEAFAWSFTSPVDQTSL